MPSGLGFFTEIEFSCRFFRKKLTYKSKAMDKVKKDNMVDIAIEADARSVSLFSCDERIYNAGDVGNVK